MKLIIILSLLSFFTFSQNMAKVKLMRGKVSVKNKDSLKKIKPGDWLNQGDTIITGDKSFVRLNFIDDSKVNVGPNSKVVIERFSKDRPGVLSVVTGKIRAEVSKDYLKMKKNKSKLFVKSDHAVMGIRGTDFLFSTASKNSKTTAVLFEGSVLLNNLKFKDLKNYKKFESIVEKGVRLNPGDFSVVSKNSKRPLAPKKMNSTQLKKLQKQKLMVEGSAKVKATSLSKKIEKIDGDVLQISSGKVIDKEDAKKGFISENGEFIDSKKPDKKEKSKILPPIPNGRINPTDSIGTPVRERRPPPPPRRKVKINVKG